MLSFYLSLTDSEEEKSKLETLYGLYKKRMWYVANNILHDPSEAEDAVHNAFLGITKNITHIGDPESGDTFAYIMTAARNAALNLVKKNRRSSVYNFDDFGNAPDDNAILERCKLENKDLVISVLRKMPEKYRDILYFRFYADLSEKEIAAQTGLRYETARKQISRAKILFKELLEKEGETIEQS